MFKGCLSLTNINLTKFNTNNVTNMSSMFKQCISLKNLNLSNINIKKVTNMWDMFYRCSSSLQLNIINQYSNFRNEAFDINLHY